MNILTDKEEEYECQDKKDRTKKYMCIRRRKKSKAEADDEERQQKEGAIAAERGLHSISNHLSRLRLNISPQH